MSDHPALSASRIKTLQTCSWIYYSRYHLKLPDKSNDGASRGTVCHAVFECLGNPRHKHHYDDIMKADDIGGSTVVERMVETYAKKLLVNDDENMQLIKDMIMNGLKYDFFGETIDEPTEAISEKDFDLFVDEDGKKYRIKGFIDKLFLYGKKKRALIRDFKSSKQVFKGKDVTDNLQDLMYSLAVRKLYPEYLRTQSEFVFLKFDLSTDMLGNKGKGIVEMAELSDEELSGFEYELTEIQNYIDNFTELDGKSKYAAQQDYPKDGTFGGPLACGREGYKKRKGEYLLDDNGDKIPNFICSYRRPFNYFVVLNKSGKIIRSAFEEQDIGEIKESQTIESRYYSGCPYWNDIL